MSSAANPLVAETRAELRAVSKKLSSCEAALEGQGAYLGIRDPVTLLDQLKTLQKKEEQLREVLLILLRAPPQAPSPAANPMALLPHGQHQQQQQLSNGFSGHQLSHMGMVVQHSNGRSTVPTAEDGAAAEHLSHLPLPSRPPGASSSSSSSSSRRSRVPGRSAKTTSLHEALGIPPPEDAAAGAGARAGAGGGSGGVGGGGGGGGGGGAPSSASQSGAPYRPGQHALYRFNKAPAVGGGGGGPVSEWERQSAGAGAGAAGPNAGSGTGARSAGGTTVAERGRDSSSSFSSSSSPSFSSPSPSALGLGLGLGLGGQPRSSLPAAGAPSPTPSPSIPAAAGAGAYPAASGSAEAAAAAAEDARAPRQTASKPSQETAAMDPEEVKVKEELIEDMQDRINEKVSGFVADKSNRLLVEGLGAAATRAAARAAAAVAMRPTTAMTKPAHLHYQLKTEAGRAIESAVTSLVSDKSSTNLSKKYLATGLSNRVLDEVMAGWDRNFEFEAGSEGVKRKAVDKSRRVDPAVRPARPGDVRTAETVTIDGAERGMEGRTSPGSKPPSDEVDPLEEAPEGEEEAAAGRDREITERQPGGGGEKAQQPAAATDVDEVPASEPAPVAPATPTTASPAPAPAAAAKQKTPTPRLRIIHSGSLGAPVSPPSTGSGRPERKRRKSAEAGGWRSRYDKDEFESGEALLSSTDDETEGEEGEDEDEDDGETEEGVGRSRRRRGSRLGWDGDGGEGPGGAVNGGGEGVDAEDEGSDEVDVGVDDYDEEEDEEDELDGGGAGRGRAGKRKAEGGAAAAAAAAAVIKKRSPPNAWKRRCADGNCQLGASFGTPGKPAKYCSAHKDPGMVNVTHRLCEEPGCMRQPSFNMAGLKKALFCGTHKKAGMINVSSPRCEAQGCMVRPSFGYEGDRKATLCDAHKKMGMTNIRKKPRRKSIGDSGFARPALQQGMFPGISDAVVAAAAAAAAAAASGGSSHSFQSSFLSDSHPTTAAAVLARFGDDSGTGGALSTGKGKGAGGAAPAGEGDSQPRPGSFLEAVDMAAGGSASEGVSFAA